VDNRDVLAALEGAEGSGRGVGCARRVNVGLVKPDMDSRVLGGRYGILKGAEGVGVEAGDERSWGGNDPRMVIHANRIGYIGARNSNLAR
jgi:hypothetical protein